MLSVDHDQNLACFNTMGLPSQADTLLHYDDAVHLAEVSDLAQRYTNVFVLGGGSNVILAPRLSGLVIKVQSRGVQLLDQVDDELVVQAQAGEGWHEFVAFCVAQGWHGLENLALIPGTVGAAPVQNIGAYGVELAQRFHSLLAWHIPQGRLLEMGPDDCGFAYRDSIFKRSERGQWLIVAVRFRLSAVWRPVLDYPALANYAFIPPEPSQFKRSAGAGQAGLPTARQVFDAVCTIRRSKLPDPAVLANTGSFFKNPLVSVQVLQELRDRYPEIVAYPQTDGSYKLAAGWLIERTGWKGRRLGPVGMHDRQALVLANYGQAAAQDVLRLAQRVRDDVQAQFGVWLEQEPVWVG